MVMQRLGIGNKQRRAALTPTGRQKLETVNLPPATANVMWYLKEHGTSCASEIAEGVAPPMEHTRVKGILKHLAQEDRKWVEWV